MNNLAEHIWAINKVNNKNDEELSNQTYIEISIMEKSNYNNKKQSSFPMGALSTASICRCTDDDKCYINDWSYHIFNSYKHKLHNFDIISIKLSLQRHIFNNEKQIKLNMLENPYMEYSVDLQKDIDLLKTQLKEKTKKSSDIKSKKETSESAKKTNTINSKYKLIKSNITNKFGTTLFRVKSLKDFNVINNKGELLLEVKKGDLGGFVETENNLSQFDCSWISEKAMVYDNAIVRDNAYVYGAVNIYNKAIIAGYANVRCYADISGSAIIKDNAFISGHAIIKDSVKIDGDATVLDNAIIKDNVQLLDKSFVYENATVYGSAIITGETRIRGDARVADIHIKDNMTIEHNAFINSPFNYLKIVSTGFKTNECLDEMMNNDDIVFFRTVDYDVMVSFGTNLYTLNEFSLIPDKKYSKIITSSIKMANDYIETFGPRDKTLDFSRAIADSVGIKKDEDYNNIVNKLDGYTLKINKDN